MNFIQSLKIYDTGLTKVRIGDKHDGGYVVLDEVSKMCEKLYSYGVETNSSFENEFVQRYDCNAHLFDHTVETAAEVNPKFTFDKEGLSFEKKGCFNTLENHLNKYGNPFHKTLKMDVEWCEWDIFESVPDHILDNFDQILCEFHIVPVKYLDKHTPYFTQFHQSFYHEVNNILFKKYKKTLDRLQKFYYIFHVHANNSIPCNEVDGELIPPLLEMSLVNKQCVSSVSLSKSKYPMEGLDYPNKTDRPDIENISWNS